jgi:hypothetical protein
VKAARGKSAHAVWAADGGQRESAPPPTRLEPIPQFKATAKLGQFLETRFSQSF